MSDKEQIRVHDLKTGEIYFFSKELGYKEALVSCFFVVKKLMSLMHNEKLRDIYRKKVEQFEVKGRGYYALDNLCVRVN